MRFKPVARVAVVGCHAARVGFVVTNDVLDINSVGGAKPCAELSSKLVNRREVRLIIQAVLAHLEADIAVVGAAAGVPACSNDSRTCSYRGELAASRHPAW